jgi:hypothetical protein
MSQNLSTKEKYFDIKKNIFVLATSHHFISAEAGGAGFIACQLPVCVRGTNCDKTKTIEASRLQIAKIIKLEFYDVIIIYSTTILKEAPVSL